VKSGVKTTNEVFENLFGFGKSRGGTSHFWGNRPKPLTCSKKTSRGTKDRGRPLNRKKRNSQIPRRPVETLKMGEAGGGSKSTYFGRREGGPH